MTAVSEPTSPSKNLVGPVIQAGEIADAVVAAVREDNPGKAIRARRMGADEPFPLDAKLGDAGLLPTETIEFYFEGEES